MIVTTETCENRGQAIGTLIAERGCELLYYEAGRVAFIRLPSKEELLVSMGSSTMKVFRKAWPFSWVTKVFRKAWPFTWGWAKTVLSVDLISIGWYECIPLTRDLLSLLFVVKTIDLLTNARSISEVIQKYGGNFANELCEAVEKDEKDGGGQLLRLL